jgi:hypothetical protein
MKEVFLQTIYGYLYVTDMYVFLFKDIAYSDSMENFDVTSGVTNKDFF